MYMHMEFLSPQLLFSGSSLVSGVGYVVYNAVHHSMEQLDTTKRTCKLDFYCENNMLYLLKTGCIVESKWRPNLFILQIKMYFNVRRARRN